MKIQVLGSGCSTCHKLYEITTQAVKELQLKDKVEYITDIQKIIEMGIMQSPVLTINGKPVIVASIPDISRIKELIRENNG